MNRCLLKKGLKLDFNDVVREQDQSVEQWCKKYTD